MAKTWTNTVPQGVTGTGNAQVFGVNPLAGQFANQLGNLRTQQEREAQQIARAWRDNQLAASSGRLWANDMAGIEKDFINRGIELQKKGVNPYGSSQEALDYQRDKRYVEAQQGYRKAVETRLNDALTKINAGPGKYDPKSIQALHDFFGKTKLKDAFESNLDIPQLTERFDVSEYLKPFKAITKQTESVAGKLKTDEKVLDEEATANMLLGALARDPRGAEKVAEITSGFPVPAVKSFSPNYADNVKLVTDYIQGNPREREQLATQGILPGTPVMEEYISDLAQKQTQARKKFDNEVEALVAASASDLDLFKKQVPFKDPNEMTEYQKQQLALSRQRENRMAATAAGKGSDNEAETPRNVNIQYKADDPSANVDVKDYVGLSVPAKSFVGLPTYNLSSGSRSEKLNPSVDAKVVGVGNFPIIKRGALKGQIAQPNFEKEHPDYVEGEAMVHIKEPVPGNPGAYTDKLIPYSALPANVKNSKAVKEALGNFKPASNKPASAKPATVTKTIPVTKIKSLVGKPGYEGYTEKELIEYYRSQGYKIN
jgi:hypothetical protein